MFKAALVIISVVLGLCSCEKSKLYSGPKEFVFPYVYEIPQNTELYVCGDRVRKAVFDYNSETHVLLVNDHVVYQPIDNTLSSETHKRIATDHIREVIRECANRHGSGLLLIVMQEGGVSRILGGERAAVLVRQLEREANEKASGDQ